ncbi:hypothetical protein PHLCEN_2v9087 [Hermanssonia centrifuga]|uniref:PIN domain-like protein n=1 Tax=Hermanssonia centrifuga TaxID=98765 RepID=A0A2R6NS02_9APHY|nr:hypothetical protein PHLCEN_2v9087 [Hermanssonia centrifuga]
MEGKAMAIDSSIWIYQFQATMRDKEGRGLINAHVLGFLRRISKLLFYGIKPVFVFDGGAPTLKRSTIIERKNKKSGAVASHAKVAERLLAAHMRREALNQAQAHSSQVAIDKPAIIDENTVYLEDLIQPNPRTPVKITQKDQNESPPSSKKKSRWHDHDPYKLPEVNLDERIANATRSSVPDPRLATEDELRAFIEDMRPEDFDVNSPAFRELPTEVQYEIIGDLRLKSRQTSYKRLQNMLKNAKTPLDFSKEQIKNLKQRNSLTQQLFVTTDSIGKAHVEIPIRIASERNREYILIKNEGEGGGWILGIRDEGTRSKPIEIDQDPKPEVVNEDSEDDMEEVEIETRDTVDPDLREYRRNQALSALANRYSPKKLAPLTTKQPNRAKHSKPLFAPEDSDTEQLSASLVTEGIDPDLSIAIQESIADKEENDLRRAIAESRAEFSASASRLASNAGASSSRSQLHRAPPVTPRRDNVETLEDHLVLNSESDDADLYASPTRLETALSIANAGPRKATAQTDWTFGESTFGTPTLLLPAQTKKLPDTEPQAILVDSEDDLEEVQEIQPQQLPDSVPSVQVSVDVSTSLETLEPGPLPADDSDVDMEEVVPMIEPLIQSVSSTGDDSELSHPANVESSELSLTEIYPTEVRPTTPATSWTAAMLEQSDTRIHDTRTHVEVPATPPSSQPVLPLLQIEDDSSESEPENSWTRPQVPTHGAEDQVSPPEENWDAAQEMDPQAEEGEFVRFMSQVRGKNLDDVRREIDDEIKALNQQKKVAMRDSDDITQQMISQIMMMLRLFGIPYITAPMEAEAQCAELLTLGLVDGIITDDSDVFLFGGMRVLRNMFNQSKTVECFLLPDLERELSLDREKLVRLAYLLGSDYTEGLPGVGPVVAMELLTEFSGSDGLHQFREWWRKVQSGRDTEEDNRSKFRKRFKKRFKDLFLAEDWPNPAVRDAYYHPTVDSSEEPFKWGLPDLDALRDFFNSELGWDQAKVDDLLLPIIRKMGKRNQSGGTNKQGNLISFFDVPAGGAAPRKRQTYASKRLQQVVSDFRKQQAANAGNAAEKDTSDEDEDQTGHGDEIIKRPKKRRKASVEDRSDSTTTLGRGGKTTRGRGQRRGRGGSTRGGRSTKGKKISTSHSASSDQEIPEHATTVSPPPPLAVNLRPRPKPKPAYKSKAVTDAEGSGANDV